MAVEYQALVGRFYEEFVNGNDPEAARALCTPGYAHHDLAFGEGEIRGLDAYLGAVAAFRATYPNFLVEVANIISASDRVAVEWTATGGQAAGGFISTHRIADGKIAESWVHAHLPRADVG